MEDDRAVRFGVERRLELLAAVRDGTDRAALADRLGVSPSTVDRGVDELADANLVATTPDGPRLTAAGELILTELERLRALIDGVGRAGAILAGLPRDAPLHPAVVAGTDGAETIGGRVGTASPDAAAGIDPTDGSTDCSPAEDAIERSAALVARASRVDAIAGPVHPPQLTAGRRIDGGTTLRVALGGAALGTLAGRDREGLRPTLEGATVRFGVFGGEFPYTLLSARTAEGPVVGLLTAGGYVETGDAAAVDWTAERFATVWADCDPLPVYDGDG